MGGAWTPHAQSTSYETLPNKIHQPGRNEENQKAPQLSQGVANQEKQDEPQWIVAKRLLSALTILGSMQVVCKGLITSDKNAYYIAKLCAALAILSIGKTYYLSLSSEVIRNTV